MKLVVTGRSGVIACKMAFWSLKQASHESEQKRSQSNFSLGLVNAGILLGAWISCQS